MDFEERLKRAVARGKQRSDEDQRQERANELSQQEIKQKHSAMRLQISDHIETALKKLPGYFPGFQYETVFGDRGWGGACYRDDFNSNARGKRDNDYSRLEVTVRPLASYPILEVTAKGTIKNREVYSRNNFAELEDADASQFIAMVDQWIIEYAELFASQN